MRSRDRRTIPGQLPGHFRSTSQPNLSNNHPTGLVHQAPWMELCIFSFVICREQSTRNLDQIHQMVIPFFAAFEFQESNEACVDKCWQQELQLDIDFLVRVLGDWNSKRCSFAVHTGPSSRPWQRYWNMSSSLRPIIKDNHYSEHFRSVSCLEGPGSAWNYLQHSHSKTHSEPCVGFIYPASCFVGEYCIFLGSHQSTFPNLYLMVMFAGYYCSDCLIQYLHLRKDFVVGSIQSQFCARSLRGALRPRWCFWEGWTCRLPGEWARIWMHGMEPCLPWGHQVCSVDPTSTKTCCAPSCRRGVIGTPLWWLIRSQSLHAEEPDQKFEYSQFLCGSQWVWRS